MVESKADIAFLGFAERANSAAVITAYTAAWNVIGLSQTLFIPFVPSSLSGVHMGVAIRGITLDRSAQFTLRLRAQSGTEFGYVNLAVRAEDLSPADAAEVLVPLGWRTFFFKLDPPGPTIAEFGRTFVVASEDGGPEEIIGEFLVLERTFPALTPERIAAIKSDPSASKAVRVEFTCSTCTSKVSAYSALERSKKLEEEGDAWHETLPDRFICDCRKMQIDLGSLKRNLAGLIGRPIGRPQVGYIPLYEQSVSWSRLLGQVGSEVKVYPRC